MIRRVVALGALVVALVVVFAAPASAHAELLSTDPSSGGVYTSTPPKAVTLRFSEPVEVALGGVRVFTADRIERIGLAVIFEGRGFRSHGDGMAGMGGPGLAVKGGQHFVERTAPTVLGGERRRDAHPGSQILQPGHQVRGGEDVLEAVVVAMQVQHDIGLDGRTQDGEAQALDGRHRMLGIDPGDDGLTDEGIRVWDIPEDLEDAYREASSDGDD